MAKNSQILSVSVTKDQAEFLDEHDFSASLLIQKAIDEQMEVWKKMHTEVGRLNQSIDQLLGLQAQLFKFLELNGLSDKFCQWRGEESAKLL